MSPFQNKYFLIIFGALPCLALDQLTKFWVTSSVRPDHSIPILDGFFHITLKFNPGAAFGLFRGQPLPFFLSVSFFAVSFILYFIFRIDPARLRLATALSFIFGGALGNISDRIRLGAVVDFLDLHYQETVWPTFNVADVAIVVGVALFIRDMAKNGMSYEARTAPTENESNVGPIQSAADGGT